MKKCPKCLLEKSEKEFSLNKRKKDGRQTYCKQCCKIINNDTYKRLPNRRLKIKERNKNQIEKVQKFLFEYLETKKCSICGFDNILALDFHHKNRKEKSFNIADSVGLKCSLKTLVEEIDKCDIICANCHRILEANKIKTFKLRHKH